MGEPVAGAGEAVGFSFVYQVLRKRPNHRIKRRLTNFIACERVLVLLNNSCFFSCGKSDRGLVVVSKYKRQA